MNTSATERDPRVQQMIDDPAKYFAEARRKARLEAREASQSEAAIRRSLGIRRA